jgi:hypothetical protein
MKLTTHHTAIKISIALALITVSLGTASATPRLTGTSFDPAFISAGDRVNISANLEATEFPDKTWEEDMNLRVTLEPGNRLTREYVTIEDDRDETIGFLYPQGVWNQRYQVKVDSGAPTGMYDFELHIQYLEDGENVEIPTEEGSRTTVIKSFSMPVDNEGVDLTADVQGTSPTVPRPGDDYVEMNLNFVNTGNKPVEEVEIRPETPENIETSYSADEKFYISKIMEGRSYPETLTVNLEEELEPGTHWIELSTTYEDEDSNPYSEQIKVPIRVEGKPDLEVVDSRMEMKAGATSDLRVRVKNTGEQDAESVTARVIVERAQPFSLEDRSSYIGEIESGETGTAVMKISADASAAMKQHNIKVELRANGDSEEGDNSVYTFTEDTGVEINGKTQSPLIYVGIAGALLVLAFAGYRYFSSREKEEAEEGESDGS